MLDPRHCPHEHTIPVNTEHPDTPTTVARLCLDCDEQLHPAWACPDCEWEHDDIRTLGDPEPIHVHHLARRCGAHVD